MSDSLQPHELQHARLPCPSLSPQVCSYSCPLSQWYHPTISSSVAPFSFCSQSFPASGSFPINWLFVSGAQSTGASASAEYSGLSSFNMNWSISLLFKGLSRIFSSTTVWKHQFFGTQQNWVVQLSHSYMTTRKAIAFMDLCGQSNVSAF